jgi:NADH dehydrogenase
VYRSLYKMHQLALHGYIRVAANTLANLLTRRSKPRLKLH